MKKTILTILWMLAFFVIGAGIDIGFMLLVSQRHHLFRSEELQSVADSVLSWVLVVCLPFLALFLCWRGKLPGTQSRKIIVQP